MRILLVEDAPSFGETLHVWLQLDGYAVVWLRRGDQALATPQTHDDQCVLLDRGLPGLEGDAVLADLRSRKAQVPVILIIVRDTLADRVQGLDFQIRPDKVETSVRVELVETLGQAQGERLALHRA